MGWWGVFLFFTGNLIKPVFGLQARDLMGDNVLHSHYSVVTQKYTFQSLLLQLVMNVLFVIGSHWTLMRV